MRRVDDSDRRVRAAIELWRERLSPGMVGLACSGGADSMALADAAIRAFGTSNVIVIHIDHGLGAGSAQIGERVAAWARGRGVAAIVRRIEVPRRASLEAAARDARYAALDAIAIEVGASWILLGHTARDQAETVLMRIVRGTGPAGLAGIPTMRGHFVRPLLEIPRAAIDGYVAAQGLPTWADPMNDDPRFARVRFRERIMPALRAENPALDDALCRLATSAREWLIAIENAADKISSFPLDCRVVLQIDDAAVRKCGYAMALDAAGVGFDAVHLDAIDDLTTRPAAGEHAVDVPGGRVVRSYDTVELQRGPAAAVRSPIVEDLSPPPGCELRPWRPGDRMKPARLKGRSRKLSDLYIDAKAPRELRRTARVVVRASDQVIVWAEHLGLAFGESPENVPLPRRKAGRV